MITLFWIIATGTIIGLSYQRVFTGRDVSSGDMGIALIAYCVATMVCIGDWQRRRRERS